jgi:hypothetical protein
MTPIFRKREESFPRQAASRTRIVKTLNVLSYIAIGFWALVLLGAQGSTLALLYVICSLIFNYIIAVFCEYVLGWTEDNKWKAISGIFSFTKFLIIVVAGALLFDAIR